MDQSSKDLMHEIDEHRRVIEETVREIEDRVSPRHLSEKLKASTREVVDDLRREGMLVVGQDEETYLGNGGKAGDATLVARGLIRRYPAMTAGTALIFGLMLGGLRR